MKQLFGLFLIAFVALSVYDYCEPLGLPFFTENNPVASVITLVNTSSQETTSNVIALPSYNLDFEYGIIGWRLHSLYSVPPDYWDSTFEESKSGRQSLRIAHSCDSTVSSEPRKVDASNCLFRSDKLPPFENNVYVKFYIKSIRHYENAWWDDPLFEFKSLTTHSLNVEAIDEWGERIYTKDIIRDVYNYQNSQLVKIVEYDASEDINATEYFKKINGYDYNATVHGDLNAIQAMIDMQNSFTSGTVYYYVADTNTLPGSSYAVYLGDGWYTIIMPVPKDTRYLGFNSQVYCSGQNEGWLYGAYVDTYFPNAPAKAETLTYLDGITFIRTLTNSDITDVLPTSTIDSGGATWTEDEEIIENVGDEDTVSTVTTMQLIKKFWWIPFLIGLSFIFGTLYNDKPKKKVKRKVKKK